MREGTRRWSVPFTTASLLSCPVRDGWRTGASLLLGWAVLMAGSAALTPLCAQNTSNQHADEQQMPAWLANHSWVPIGEQTFKEDDLIAWEQWRVSLPDSPDNPLDRAFLHRKARPPLRQNDVGVLQFRIYTTY